MGDYGTVPSQANPVKIKNGTVVSLNGNVSRDSWAFFSVDGTLDLLYLCHLRCGYLHIEWRCNA